ncbi:protease SohB [Jejubacter calystegiae]|uniref:Protease SohB n=1 Tax=Jejubacter calystegiae TaxID=2579935 RepID=A0A4P8YS46_9ENTR|nr:protease SohB [Jejubacter calystegiae]QCT21582.1 protease SohB [Jejubacter calystegiae]
MDLIVNYGLFLARVVTVVVAIAVVVMLVANAARHKKQQRGELRVTKLNEQYQEMQNSLSEALLDDPARKLWLKEQKRQRKQEAKAAKARAKLGQVNTTSRKPVLWVLDFKGSMDAHEVTALREEISAVLATYKPGDEVLLRLESPGGVVHGYGLAASQLQRLRDHKVPLTVAVDKVAASGGYMMACVADRIVSAPFAIIGSIGVVAQVPNFHRLLQRNNIDVELHTAGQYKRTLTLFGENTPEGRDKFREDLNETHQLFKSFVHSMRPALDVEAVATGEHWYGSQAQDKGLVDEIGTSDDWLLARLERFEAVNVHYVQRKKLVDRFTRSAAESADRLLLRWWQRGERPLP